MKMNGIRNRQRLIPLGMAICITSLLGQAPPLRVPPEEGISKVIKIVEAGPVSGVYANSVLVDLVVGTDGTVEAVKVLKGHQAQVPSAVAAARQWRFSPFVRNGAPVRAVVETSVYVSDQPIAPKPLAQCMALVNARKGPEAEVECRKALDGSDRGLAEALAEQWLGHAILMQGRATDALSHYEKGLAIATGVLGPEDADLASAYRNLAFGHVALRQWNKADEYYQRATSTFESAIRALPAMSDRYQASLKSALSDHANVKRALGDQAGAAALDARAANIKSSRDDTAA
jgi:hypothetical protein